MQFSFPSADLSPKLSYSSGRTEFFQTKAYKKRLALFQTEPVVFSGSFHLSVK
ncbi:hypothetical protein CLOSTMETH_02052 [[Clostridium] methylpentosum DSM 5476]|uniref:Uncharacterized protein n=1 Tax=[Clostridium] methylpentosum DSM 5476 TaxID=537013 RepID=C0EDX3_9FIRM|nr:hypothetical protein CLOSTMETH_02052 [[Clostridium] methylpentosum DSM 5476]